MDFPFPKSYGLTSWYIENSSAGSLQMVAAAMKLKHGCSLEEKLWKKKKKKSYDQPRQHIKKKRYYFTSKGLYRQSYGFSSNHVWLWELDNKKAESWRIDAFELWCWRRLLRVPWTARRLNQSILKKISPEYSLEGLMLKLKLQSFGHLIQRTDPFEIFPDAGKDWVREDKRTTEDEMIGWHHQLNGHEFE